MAAAAGQIGPRGVSPLPAQGKVRSSFSCSGKQLDLRISLSLPSLSIFFVFVFLSFFHFVSLTVSLQLSPFMSLYHTLSVSLSHS